MNATGKRRLLKLADFLESDVPAERFDMDVWGTGDAKGMPACGTSACALGWSSAVPSLRKAGARLARGGRYFFSGGTPDEVAKRVFDMDHSQFQEIFTPIDSAKLRGRRALWVVAQRIRKFVARQEATEAKQ